jgi:deoxyribonuclease IV
MDKLRFATAGIPFSTKKANTVNGIKRVRELKLDAMELEFVRSVNISKEKAPEVNETAKKNDVKLTVHGSYYINLNAQDKAKWHASISRIVQAAKIGYLCGAYSVCFHPAYYMKDEPKKVYEKVKEGMKKITKELKDNGIDIWIRPETMGKPTQFGDFREAIDLSSEFDRVLPCVDFAHQHARTGKYNTKKEFEEILNYYEKKLGKEALKEMHIHLSGINYGEKGEKNHLILKESDMNYKDLLKVFKEYKLKGVVVCESPNLEEDALLLKKTYDKV